MFNLFEKRIFFRFIVSGGGVWTDVFSIKQKESDAWVSITAPFRLVSHCMSQMDSLTLVITGGKSLKLVVGKSTYFYDLLNGQFRSQSEADLLTARANHGCSFITGPDGSPTAIIAGGEGARGALNSVEIYDRATGGWELGPNLPFVMKGFQVKGSPNIIKIESNSNV